MRKIIILERVGHVAWKWGEGMRERGGERGCEGGEEEERGCEGDGGVI